MLAASPLVSDDSAARAAVEACAARFATDAYGPQAVCDDSRFAFEGLLSGSVALLPDQGLLALTGDERVRFLQSLTTNDVERQPEAQARWHGLCTPKGRLVATMLAWREPSEIRLLLPQPQAAPVRKRLSMYVLRAKVRVEDCSDAFAVIGLCGERAAGALAGLGLPAPAAMAVARAPIDAAPEATATVIGLPAVGGGTPGERVPLQRWMLVVPAAALASLWASLVASLQPIGSAAWRWTDVRSGIARIVPLTSEQFVPQMINFDTVGGVSFDKGCYPGQEVVARSHYLGKVKRRVFLAHLAGPEPAPGTEVFAGAPEPVGLVVTAAPAPGGGTDLLLEARAAAAAQADALRIDGRPLRIDALPYPMPAGD